MAKDTSETLFALDCGATNWRLYRVSYQAERGRARVRGEPQPAPLTSFVDHRLPAAILLDAEGGALESFGEVAQQGLESEVTRERVRDYFKPCIGVHLEEAPLPHQKRYTHAEALRYTGMLLRAVVEQVRLEKWRAAPFDERVRFSFAHPVHWLSAHDAQVLGEFQDLVLSCLPEQVHDRVRFVAEPEGAILSLQRQGLLADVGDAGVTLIIDVGGSTTDVVAGQVNPRTGEIEYAGRYGEPFGGGLYDAELAKVIADALGVPASALADDPSTVVSLRTFGRRLKESLSRQLLNPTGSPHVPERSITLVTRGGEVYRRPVRLEEGLFLETTRHLNEGFESLIGSGLEAMGLADADVAQVVLVGGGSQLFTIVRHLRERFGGERIVLADNPDEIVVRGIGLEYGAAVARSRPSLIFSVAPAAGAGEARSTDPVLPTPSAARLATPITPTSGGFFPGAYRLVSDEDERLPLPPGKTVVGRARTSDIQLPDKLISRTHAELRLEGNVLVVVDLESTNGTFVNNERITPNQPHVLKSGDELKFAATRFTCIG